MSTSLPIPSVVIAEEMPSSQYPYKYSLGLLKSDGHTEFSINFQPDNINNISAQNVNAAPNYGLFNLGHHIILHSFIFS